MQSKPDIVEKALTLAYQFHGEGVRKVDQSPYIIHPIMVAMILSKNQFSDETIAAGYCHDLLEDTNCPENLIIRHCGKKVLDIVKAVTNKKELKGKEYWWKKKKLYIETVRNGPHEAKAVCVADKIHNLKSLITAFDLYGTRIWPKFNHPKEDKLKFEQMVYDMLAKTWDYTPLLQEYLRLINVFKILIKSRSKGSMVYAVYCTEIYHEEDDENYRLVGRFESKEEAEKAAVKIIKETENLGYYDREFAYVAEEIRKK